MHERRSSWLANKCSAGINPMDAQGKPTRNPCKKLHELPSVSTDWQQTTWCPECEYYDRGTCGSAIRADGSAACPLDGKQLPLRAVAVESSHYQAAKPLQVVLPKGRECQPPAKALEQAIQHRIVERTGGRIYSLKVEVIGTEVIIRGTATCYHVKQLALQGVLDVTRFADEIEIEINLQVQVCPTKPESAAR
jgi:hypothetical protein